MNAMARLLHQASGGHLLLNQNPRLRVIKHTNLQWSYIKACWTEIPNRIYVIKHTSLDNYLFLNSSDDCIWNGGTLETRNWHFHVTISAMLDAYCFNLVSQGSFNKAVLLDLLGMRTHSYISITVPTCRPYYKLQQTALSAVEIIAVVVIEKCSLP